MLLLLAWLASAADPFVWKHDGEWRSPTVPEREAVIEATEMVVRDAHRCSAPVLAQAGYLLDRVGLRLEELEVDGVRMVRIGEGETSFGAGLLAVRCGEARDLVWQSPHPRFDRGTGKVVLHLFLESQARAALWATHHRHRATGDELREDRVHPADVAAEPGSLFQAMTVALAVGDLDLRFVQVHGFAQGSAPDIDAIVSGGQTLAEPRTVGERLDALFGRVAVHGEDTRELGGVRNAQGRLLARWPGRFLHLELSPVVRERMEEDAVMRGLVVDALEGPW